MPVEERLAVLLEAKPRTPVIFVESVTWDETRQPFDCYQSWLRSDRMKIEIDVVAAPASARLAVERALKVNGSLPRS
jgi:hypothetical protein